MGRFLHSRIADQGMQIRSGRRYIALGASFFVNSGNEDFNVDEVSVSEIGVKGSHDGWRYTGEIKLYNPEADRVLILRIKGAKTMQTEDVAVDLDDPALVEAGVAAQVLLTHGIGVEQLARVLRVYAESGGSELRERAKRAAADLVEALPRP